MTGISTPPVLTIGILTFRRPQDVARLVGGLLSGGVDGFARILVLDDGPDAQTQAALAPFADRITLIVHDVNRGYARSFCHLFALCETPYLMVTADDDVADADEIRRSAEMAARLAVDFAAPVFLDATGRRYRGRDSTGRISLSDVRWASGHAPGLVYRVAAARRFLPVLAARLDKGCYAGEIYPQTILAYLLCFDSQECRWLPTAPIREGEPRPSQLRDSDGTRYNSVAGRLREQLAFREVFTDIAAAMDNPAKKASVAAVARLHDQDIYRRVTREIRREHPECVTDWVSGGIYFNRRSVPRHMLNLLRWLRARRGARRTLRAVDRARDAVPPGERR